MMFIKVQDKPYYLELRYQESVIADCYHVKSIVLGYAYFSMNY